MDIDTHLVLVKWTNLFDKAKHKHLVLVVMCNFNYKTTVLWFTNKLCWLFKWGSFFYFSFLRPTPRMSSATSQTSPPRSPSWPRAFMAETSSAICRVQDTSTTSASSLEPPIPKSEKEIKNKLHAEEGFPVLRLVFVFKRTFRQKISILNIILTSFQAAALNDHGVGHQNVIFTNNWFQNWYFLQWICAKFPFPQHLFEWRFFNWTAIDRFFLNLQRA